ncbi:MAG: rhomboid family intramembrane serine protease [Verrucomicrobiota bacterium]|nr:rhomboid family intramembrane serine protease [Verrucomicrobiota bacterium]
MSSWSGSSYSPHPYGWDSVRHSGAFHLIIINLASFLLISIFLLLRYQTVTDFLGLSINGLMQLRLWQPLSFSFIYQNPINLILSLLMIWLFAPSLEQHVGRTHLYGIYASGIFAGAVFFLAGTLLFQQSGLIALGSTCATSAIFMAFVALYPNVEFLFGIRAKYWAMIAAAISLWFLVVSQSLLQLLPLSGMLAGLLYIKWLNAETVSSFINRNLGTLVTKAAATREIYNRQGEGSVEAETSTSKDHFISHEVDPILDKISKHGMQSLSADERRILDKASRKLGK